MTNPTPRDSAQLPPLPDTVAAFRDKGTFTMPEQFYPADVIDAREALRAQPASVEPIGEFVDGGIVWAKPGSPIPPSGTKLYAAAPPAHIPAVEALDDANPLMALAECAALLENPRLRGDGVRCEVAAKNARAVMRLLSASSPATAVDAPDVVDGDKLRASAHCPICGHDQPHCHPKEQIIGWLRAQAVRFLPGLKMTIEPGTLDQIIERRKEESMREAEREISRYAINECYADGPKEYSSAALGGIKPLPFAVFDEFGKGADDRVQDHIRAALQASRQPVTQQAVAEGAGDVTDADIRRVFLANGFTVKEGQADLKPYVFQAARALLALATTKGQRS